MKKSAVITIACSILTVFAFVFLFCTEKSPFPLALGGRTTTMSAPIQVQQDIVDAEVLVLDRNENFNGNGFIPESAIQNSISALTLKIGEKAKFQGTERVLIFTSVTYDDQEYQVITFGTAVNILEAFGLEADLPEGVNLADPITRQQYADLIHPHIVNTK